MIGTKRRIRVLQLINSFNLGGAEAVVATLSKHLDRSRFEVIPCALYRSGPLLNELQLSGLAPVVLALPRRSILTGPLFIADTQKIARVLATLLKNLSVDIIHAHLNDSILLGILAARKANGPKVCATIHNVILDEKRAWWDLRRWCSKSILARVVPRADGIVAVSNEVARATSDQLRIPLARIVTIANGIDASSFKRKQDFKALRAQLGLPTDSLILISVGRLTEQKGFPILLSALKLIPQDKRPLTIILGDGPDKMALHRLTGEYGLAETVTFLGNKTNVAEYLQASDLFAMSSLWEGLPIAILEAMACGLPVIATRVGGNSEVIEEDRSGILVPSQDPAALAQAIMTLIADPERRSELGQAAHERFESRFCLKEFIKAHEALYKSLYTNGSESPYALDRETPIANANCGEMSR